MNHPMHIPRLPAAGSCSGRFSSERQRRRPRGTQDPSGYCKFTSCQFSPSSKHHLRLHPHGPNAAIGKCGIQVRPAGVPLTVICGTWMNWGWLKAFSASSAVPRAWSLPGESLSSDSDRSCSCRPCGGYCGPPWRHQEIRESGVAHGLQEPDISQRWPGVTV